MSEIKDNDEKDSAFRGFCGLIERNPSGIAKVGIFAEMMSLDLTCMQAFVFFCNAVVRWTAPSQELNDLFSKVRCSLISRYPPLTMIPADITRLQANERTPMGCADGRLPRGYTGAVEGTLPAVEPARPWAIWVYLILSLPIRHVLHGLFHVYCVEKFINPFITARPLYPPFTRMYTLGVRPPARCLSVESYINNLLLG